MSTFVQHEQFIDTKTRDIRRQMALSVRCVECGADKGEECRGRRAFRNGKPWSRKSPHLIRYMYRDMAQVGDVD